MITHLRMKSGTSQLTVDTPPSVTIFVGPNNSGKSLCIREMYNSCQMQGSYGNKTIDEIVFQGVNEHTVKDHIRNREVPYQSGEQRCANQIRLRWGLSNIESVHEDELVNSFIDPNNNNRSRMLYVKYYLHELVLNIDGQSRLRLADRQTRGSLKAPSNPLARLLVDNHKREYLRKVLHEAFGMYFAINAQDGDALSVMFGHTPPVNERSFDDDALKYMNEAKSIEVLSDGVRAFTGILLQIMSGEYKIVFIDEPEAFLHPSLAQRLGKEIAKGAVDENKHIFVATHSAHFVMGAISSGAKVNIVRLTYEDEVGTARLLSNEALTTLMQKPMLRSANVLAGLFYNYVIVCEADSDRAFYQEINERLLACNDPRGIPHALFLNANGKDTVDQIIGPLRKLGIPCAGITDIDIVDPGGGDFGKLLIACYFPKLEHQTIKDKRSNVHDCLLQKNTKYKSNGGIKLLDGSEAETAQNLIDELSKYGLFVVPYGEVENWLKNIEVTRGKGWLHQIFEKMGANPKSQDYVHPAEGDVWDFIGSIREWFMNTKRKGIPQ